MQGSTSYTRKKLSSSETTSLILVKCQCLNYKRSGGTNAAIKRSIAMELQDCTQPQSKSLRMAIYYMYINHLDAPHGEELGG